MTEDVVYAFADMMRYILRKGSDQLSSLGDEIAYVLNYLKIQKIRLGSRLQYTIDIPDEYNIVKLPFLSLTTIVENSIKHAVEKKAVGGRIQVEDFVGVRAEQVEQFTLFGGQFGGHVAVGEELLLRVEGVDAEMVEGAQAVFLPLDATQDGLDAEGEFLHGEGLGQVIVGTNFEAFEDVLLQDLGGEERGKCFIEYIPGENAWVPIEAEGYLYINCLWVSGSLKGHGTAHRGVGRLPAPP